jgi:hypothetical protein
MDFLSSFIQQTQQSVIEGVQRLVEENHIKERVVEEAQGYAQRIANQIQDPRRAEPIETFPGVPIGEPNQLIEYCLVLDYLESIGLKFAPTVFRYEAQHPNQFAVRTELAKQLNLRAYDRTPLLVQMIEEKRKSLGKWD